MYPSSSSTSHGHQHRHQNQNQQQQQQQQQKQHDQFQHSHTRHHSTSSATACSLRSGHGLILRQHPPPTPSHASSLDDNNFDDINLSVPSAAFHQTDTRYQPGPSPFDDYTQPPSHTQRSLTNTFLDNCRPFVNQAASTIQQTSKGALHSPTKSLASFISLRGSKIAEEDQEQDRPVSAKRNSKFGALFVGASAHVNLGLVPSKTPRHLHVDEEEEEGEDSDDDMFTTRNSTAPTLQRRTTSQSATNKFSWLLPSVGVKGPRVSQPARTEDSSDELLTLNVQHALFPHGPTDPLDPASFNDLLEAAENLLQRYQSAYRSQAEQIAELKAEQSVQDEECDELETRSRHLKIQLDDMSARAAEQDAEMQSLQQQLQKERQLRIAEEEARLRRRTSYDQRDDPAWSRRQAKRTSNSAISFTDSGFDSDSEGTASSAASLAHVEACSPNWTSYHHTLTPPSTCTLASLQNAQPQEAIAMSLTPTRSLQPSRQQVTSRKMPMHHTRFGDDETDSLRQQSGAFNVIRTVRQENAQLSLQLQACDDAVDDVLDYIRSLGV
ncbi:hypothetical protein EJ05DRAFT_93437 [Pseudovirgaria hyperparasitica]|uniref:Uncharacterized protein n=1 Tax=Pseudovirgaria hyperparasitica TaxID=470096 RepID=A0A6A6W109_9PEZI|nr:uncharacterized protein EJ05DRAFT_93437 [Pseudovirgaria hyperparasitica]KAF2756205.1 hypothetical protein EJ05DRAFT_93437 [Pseudovirgaria hyperparasitica]